MKKIIAYSALLASLSALCILPAKAESVSPRYQVEVLVFQHLRDASRPIKEAFPLHPVLPTLTHALTLAEGGPDAGINDYQLLPSSTFSLSEEDKSLRKSKYYRVLVHLAWQQPISSRRSAKPVLIDGTLAHQPFLLQNRDPFALYAEGLQEDLPVEGTKNWTLKGTLTLSKSRYLHLQSNLLLHLNADAVSHKDELQDFRLIEKRRIRSKELHYVDHPRFGLLVRVTKVAS